MYARDNRTTGPASPCRSSLRQMISFPPDTIIIRKVIEIRVRTRLVAAAAADVVAAFLCVCVCVVNICIEVCYLDVHGARL